MKKPAIRLHALNLNARVRERFEHLFAATSRGAGLLVNESVAEVVLVDLDPPDAATMLAEYRQRHPARPALILARTPPVAMTHDQVLLKPVAIRALLIALQQLRGIVDQSANASDDDTHDDVDTVVIPRRPLREIAARPAPVDTPAAAEWGGGEDIPTMVIPRRASAAAPHGADPTGSSPGDGSATRDVARCAADGGPTLVDEAPGGVSNTATTVHDESLWTDLCGERADVDPGDPNAVAGLWLDGDGMLLPRLAEAARQALDGQRVLELHAGSSKIVLDGASDYAYADSDEATVRALCAAGPDGMAISVQEAGKPKAVLLSRSGNPTAHWPTVESAVWQAALWTYRGRLPTGTMLDERIYLSRWPNFTRLVDLPYAQRICALWVEQPLPLAETASLLALPQRYVFALYGATHALGLSGPARRGADHLFETTPAMLVPRRPLLGRLVHHLRAHVSDTTHPRSRATG